MTLRSLDGFVIGITADRRAGEQAELLKRRGATILHGPTIATQYLASDDDLRRATRAVVDARPDYLVATTGIGMRAWLEAASAWGMVDALGEVLGRTRIVCRGPKAAAAVQAGGLEVWGRSPTEQMDGLVEMLLQEPLAGRTVAVQEYGAPDPQPSAALRSAGAEVLEVPVYRWRLPDDAEPVLRLIAAACEDRLDAVTFTSAPAVHNLFSIADRHGLGDALRRACNRSVVVACIGPVCAEGARQEGILQPIAPEVGRMGLLVRTVSDHFRSRRRTLRLAGSELVLQGAVMEVDGERVELAPRERALLEVLAGVDGAVVSRSTLLERVWGAPGADPHVVEVTVGRLRRRMGRCAAALQASPGRGYRLEPESLPEAAAGAVSL